MRPVTIANHGSIWAEARPVTDSTRYRRADLLVTASEAGKGDTGRVDAIGLGLGLGSELRPRGKVSPCHCNVSDLHEANWTAATEETARFGMDEQRRLDEMTINHD